MCILLLGVKLQKSAGRQFVYALVYRIGCRNGVVAQEKCQRIAVNFSTKCWVRLERLELRPEQEDITLPAVIQGLFRRS